MATIAERIRLITRAELGELRERYEDPEKVINQTIADAMVSYANLKKEAGSVFEGEAQARERVESLNNEAERWHRVARKALAAGNEGDARLALSRRQDLLDRLVAPKQLYDQAHEVADAFRKRLAELEDGIRGLQAKAALIKAKEATIRATEASGKMSEGLDVLERQEQQADWNLAEAEGKAAAQRLADDPFAELEAQQAAQVADSDVDEALARLKEELGA